MRRRRSAGLIALLTAMAVVIAGCALRPSPAPSRTPDTAGVAPEYASYYSQALAWTSCEGGGFDCATVTAPRDWADPAAGDVELAVIRRRADGAQPLGSLLVNPGGPGVSGYDFARVAAGSVFPASVRAAYDIVGFDPRGVARSEGVRCLDATAMDAYLFGIPPGERGSSEWNDESQAQDDAFAAACEADSGDLLPYLSTLDAARDLDLLRGVLGDTALNYFGASWGTALGTAYAKLFPERVGRMVLDGAMDPSVSGSEVGATQAIGFEASLRAFAADCAGRDDCVYQGSVDDVMADLGALLARLDQSPLRASDGRELGADTLLTAIVTSLYDRSGWSYLRTVLSDVDGGDPTSAFTAADSYYGRSGGGYPDNVTEAFTAYNCMDYPADDEAAQQAAQDRVQREAPVTADYWYGTDVCASWPAEPTGVRERVSADGAAPILVIGTTGDPATPYAWAVSLAEQLSSGVLVTRVGEGHTGYRKGNACVDDTVDAYLVDGTVPGQDVRCE